MMIRSWALQAMVMKKPAMIAGFINWSIYRDNYLLACTCRSPR